MLGKTNTEEWTKERFKNAHVAHRINVISAFKNRTKPDDLATHCAMKDGALVTCRVLWGVLGVHVNSEKEDEPQLGTKCEPTFKALRITYPPGVEVDIIDKTYFESNLPANDIKLVLIAANKCVAHLDMHPDHGVDSTMLDAVIEVTLKEIEKRIRYV